MFIAIFRNGTAFLNLQVMLIHSFIHWADTVVVVVYWNQDLQLQV